MTAKKTPAAIAKVEEKKSNWARMRDEARSIRSEERSKIQPYEFDGTEPATIVYKPDSAEQTAALARMLDAKTGMSDGEIRELFEALLGDAFTPIWAVIKGEHASVLWLLFQDIYEHFEKPVPEEDVTPEGGV